MAKRKPYRLLPGFVVRIGEKSQYEHWQGGPCTHQGAYCERCRRPLLKIWSLDGNDPRFVDEGGQPVFGGLESLPLYYCWTCTAELAYRLVDSTTIEVLRSDVPREYAAPYPDYPLEYPRTPIELFRPAELPEVIRKYVEDDVDDPIPPEEQEALTKWFGRRVKSTLGDLWWQQFGGEPWLVQGKEKIACPNPACDRHSSSARMKILAAICNEPLAGLPMIENDEMLDKTFGFQNHWVQVVYHICDKCLTIHAGSRSD